MFENITKCTSFEWDDGNREKNWAQHRVSTAECEEVFFNVPLVVEKDVRHSDSEPRYYVLGQTNAGRRLFVVLTIRGERIRVISARDMSRQERKEYQNAQKNDRDSEF